jgi:hypothetical protein
VEGELLLGAQAVRMKKRERRRRDEKERRMMRVCSEALKCLTTNGFTKG